MKLAIRIFVGMAVALFMLALPAVLMLGAEFTAPVPPVAMAAVFFSPWCGCGG
jgi:hypothetical protein